MDRLKDNASEDLPVKYNLKFAYITTIIIAVILVIISVFSILNKDDIYPADELYDAFAPGDYVNLVAGLFILLGSMWLSRRGKLTGLLCWPGALFFVMYSYFNNLLSVPLNEMFLPYAFIIALCGYTMIAIAASIDGEAVRRRLSDTVPAKTAGGILVGLAVFVFLYNIVEVITALNGDKTLSNIDKSLLINDFTVTAPSVLIGGFLLWKRKAFGYVAGAGLLFMYGLLSLSVVPVTVIQAGYNNASPDIGTIVTVCIMAAICLVPFAFFVKGASKSHVNT